MLSLVEDLQSFGTMAYPWDSHKDIALTCLRELAA